MRILGWGRAAACVMATVFAVSQAQAAPVTFEFDTATTGWQNSLFYSEGGLDLTVTGTSSGSASKVATWSGWGLGVCSVYVWGKCFDVDHQIDSFLHDDVAVLTFSAAVTLKKLVFNLVDSTDTFDLYLDDPSWTEVLTAEDIPSGGTYIPSSEFTSFVFGVGAGTTVTTCPVEPLSFGKKKPKCKVKEIPSFFKLTAVEVETPPSEVPLPAAGLLLIGAIGGLGALKSRKRV